MIEVNITDDMYSRAKKLADAQGVLKGSFMGGRGNLVGMLGEEIFQSLFPDAIRISDTDSQDKYDYDFRIVDNLRVDVKTKNCSSIPLMHYEGSVTYKAKKPQDTDIYFFCRVSDTRIGWAIGWTISSNFLRNAVKVTKGTKAESNNSVCRRTCWSIEYGKIMPVELLQNLVTLKEKHKSD